MSTKVSYYLREPVLFASKRVVVKQRTEILEHVTGLKQACKDKIQGSLTIIFHYDTPVDGFDVEIGFPVDSIITSDGITSRNLEENEFFSVNHEGKLEDISKTGIIAYREMYNRGISAGMELMEYWHEYDNPENMKVQVLPSMHRWVHLYKHNLYKVLDKQLADHIFEGGEKITGEVDIQTRVSWVSETLGKLRDNSTNKQQFDILSEIALTRPLSEINTYKQIYQETGDLDKVIEKRVGIQPWVTEPRIEKNMVITSKTPHRNQQYLEASSFDEKRKAYCWCQLVAQSDTTPDIDPIFCYRAAGWAKQLWERVLDLPVVQCDIRKSVLKGDEHCEFALHFEKNLEH